MNDDETLISAPSPPPSPPARKLHILDLPAESLNDIFQHSSSADLVSLSLVSRRFREIAAAQLYRHFCIVFPDDDDPSYDPPIDCLAGGLDTFATSDFNYAQYLREIALDTLSGGTKGECSYDHCLYSVSCGKFMNTLLLLMLRRAKALETFTWNIRVELSRPVFKALHEIPALQHLKLRMQAGSSLYVVPPPLPAHASAYEPAPLALNPWVSGSNAIKTKPVVRHRAKKPSKPVTKPSTLAGFKNLKSLSVLEMDTLEYVDEIQTCVRNSAHTLSKLKLSFSESLAKQARKPTPEVDSDDSDQEVGFGSPITPAPGSASDDSSAPAKAFRAQKARKVQEAVLARILLTDPPLDDKFEESAASSGGEESDDDPGKAFIRRFRSVSVRLMALVNGSAPRTQHHRDTLDLVEKAAKMYVDAHEKKFPRSQNSNVKDEGAPAESSAKKDQTSPEPAPNGESSTGGGATAQVDAAAPAESPNSANPEDVDIEHPSSGASAINTETSGTPESEPFDASVKFDDVLGDVDAILEEVRAILDDMLSTSERIAAHTPSVRVLLDALQLHRIDLEGLQYSLNMAIKMNGRSRGRGPWEAKQQLKQLKQQALVTLGQLRGTRHISSLPDEDTVMPVKDAKNMNEYVRNTRGIPLQSLAIYLIPIRASVLSRAINLTALQRITLLNVGPQAPFWNHVAKENRRSPLALEMIHTDNVSMPFLNFVSEVKKITELFLVERNPKLEVESFAPRTTVLISDIRRLALKKHMTTIRKLMIKNDNDYTWDLDSKTALLICKRGLVLNELAVGFGVRPASLTKLTKLRALHIVTFRTDDTCHWVMRELRRFIVDNASHNPDMRLEYLALDDSVERVCRTSRRRRGAGKGKGKAAAPKPPPPSSSPDPESFLVPFVDSSASTSDSDASDTGSHASYLQLRSVEAMRFYDVPDVRIFRKDVMMSRL